MKTEMERAQARTSPTQSRDWATFGALLGGEVANSEPVSSVREDTTSPNTGVALRAVEDSALSPAPG